MARMDALARDVSELKAARGPTMRGQTSVGAPPRPSAATWGGSSNDRDRNGDGGRQIDNTAKICRQHVQIKRAATAWETTIPPSLNKAVDELFESLQPPMRTPAFYDELQGGHHLRLLVFFTGGELAREARNDEQRAKRHDLLAFEN